MSDERESMPSRSYPLAMLALLVAALAIGVSGYLGHAYMRNMELAQRSALRGEMLRTCRDIADAYFQLRLRMGLINTSVTARTGGLPLAETPAGMEAESLLLKLGSYGALAVGFADPSAQTRYANLTSELQNILKDVATIPSSDFDKRYEPADKLFSAMNDDCARMARLA